MAFSTLCTNDHHRQDFQSPLVINDDSSLEQDSELHSHCQIFVILGPGRPSAGGPRMDRQAVTSLGVVKISRLDWRLRRSARRGPDPADQSVHENIVLFPKT